jgi:hypothetical protein
MPNPRTPRRKAPASPLSPAEIRAFLTELFGDDLHAQRVLSLSRATLGVLTAGSLGIHAIGRGLAFAMDLHDRHTVKQVDRLFSNAGVDVWSLAASWVPHVIGDRTKVFVNLDWTEFDEDDQSMLVASMQTNHGRSTPLLWRTVVKSTIAGHRGEHEDALLVRLREVLPASVRAVIVADRGFGDSALYPFLEKLDFGYIIRFRSDVLVTSADGETRKAGGWLVGSRPRLLRSALVTGEKVPVPTVLVVHAVGMKQSWCLATSETGSTAKELLHHYGKRFTIEEMFRDLKDPRFGMGMTWTRIGTPLRRDRMLLVAALAQSLLVLLGQAAENAGIDRMLKTNTSKRRQLSLLRMGLILYERLPFMREERIRPLMNEFARLVQLDHALSSALGIK